MFKKAFTYFNFKFYFRFVLAYLVLYYSFIFVVSVSSPSGVYFPFVEKYLNFPVPIRDLVLHTSQWILSLLNYKTTLIDDRLQYCCGNMLAESPTVAMAWPCLGMGVQSCWLAFICAHHMRLSRKIQWSAGGIFAIFVVNCVRVAVMMIAMVERWTIADYLGTNAHDLFNYVCYVVLLFLVLLFYSRTKKRSSRKVQTIPPVKLCVPPSYNY